MMHMIQDRQVRHFCSFLLLFSVLAAALFSLFCHIPVLLNISEI